MTALSVTRAAINSRAATHRNVVERPATHGACSAPGFLASAPAHAREPLDSITRKTQQDHSGWPMLERSSRSCLDTTESGLISWAGRQKL